MCCTYPVLGLVRLALTDRLQHILLVTLTTSLLLVLLLTPSLPSCCSLRLQEQEQQNQITRVSSLNSREQQAHKINITAAPSSALICSSQQPAPAAGGSWSSTPATQSHSWQQQPVQCTGNEL